MAQVIDIPNAIGSFDEWSLGAGASKLAALQTNDADTGYIVSLTNGQREQVTFPALPPNPIIISVAVFRATMRASAGSPTDSVFDGVSYQSVGSLTGSYLDYAINAASLVRDTLNGYESGVRVDTSGGNGSRCTYIVRDVTYSPSTGGFVFLLGLALPLLGANLMLSDMPGIARAVARAERGRIHIIQPHEYQRHLPEFKYYRWPRTA